MLDVHTTFGVDILRDRLDMLDGDDRALMEMYLEAGSSFRQMARLACVNEVTVARRIRSMTRRLVNGQYLNCLRHRETLTAMELKVARDYYLKALPIRRISARRGWTYYRTQRTVAKIRRLLGETIQPIEAEPLSFRVERKTVDGPVVAKPPQ